MVSYDPSYKTANISQYGNPVQCLSAYPTIPAVAQQYFNGAGYAWMTQVESKSAEGYETLRITKLEGTATSSTHNDEIDHMTIKDGGHGMGLWIEKDSSGQLWVWTSLRGQNQESDPRGSILTRFKYTPGSYNISAIPGGVQFMTQFPNEYNELSGEVYAYDAATGFCVARQFDFHTGNRELYTRRKLSDVKAGRDVKYGRWYLPVNGPTLQGFATVNDTLFRWCGISNGEPNGDPGVMVASDPIALEQWDWNTGQRVGYKVFPTLGQTNSTPGKLWIDGHYEPEGCSVYRQADGTATLIVGVVVGDYGSTRRFPVYKFSNIGQAV